MNSTVRTPRRAAVEMAASTPAPDGMRHDDERGVTYLADRKREAMVAVSDAGAATVLAQGPDVGWADTFSLRDGYLYFTNSKLPEAGADVSGRVFDVWRVRLE